MYLYDLNIQGSQAIEHAVTGYFSGTKMQEILVAKASNEIELLRSDPNTGKLYSVIQMQAFGVIRSLASFRLTGGTKDYISIGSDSGRIVILEYHPEKNEFEKIHQETYGKSGCRRIVPGQHLAVEPHGRAMMISAIEKQKFVYILNRDANAKLTISSPLESNKSHMLAMCIVGVDVGFENPVFAVLETDYTEADSDPQFSAQGAEKMLTYYELDLGLNHVIRKWTEAVDGSANMLIAIPGGTDGPGGVLVCSENFITWKNQGHSDVRIPIPKRRQVQDQPESARRQGTLVISSAIHKTKSLFFLLLQTEDGDLFKVTLDYQADSVSDVKIKYFDTILPSTSLCILKTGFIFSASEMQSNYLFQIINLADDELLEFSKATLENGLEAAFDPKPLSNLQIVDEMDALNPIVDAKVLNMTGEEAPQIFVAGGTGPASSMRVLRYGLEMTEIAVSDLPGTPNGVWTLKKEMSDAYEAFIVVSFASRTVVLSVSDSIEEVSDTLFLLNTSTLLAAQLTDSSLVQIYPAGMRHMRPDGRVSEWKAPEHQLVQQCVCNGRQVVVALGAELVYFMLDDVGNLMETSERKEMSAEVLSLSMAPLLEGRAKAKFLAVGASDYTVRILSLEQDDCLNVLTMQALNSRPESLLLVAMREPGLTELIADTLFLHIGMDNGLHVRLVVDHVTGGFSDSRTRFLGPKSVRLFQLSIDGHPAVLALSSRAWLNYVYQERAYFIPLFYEMLEHGAVFGSEQYPNGLVAVAGDSFRLLAFEKLGSIFSSTKIPLLHTPRKLIFHPVSKTFVVVQSEINPIVWTASGDSLETAAKPTSDDPENDMDLDEATMGLEGATSKFLEPFVQGLKTYQSWGSAVQVVNPLAAKVLYTLPLGPHEAAFCGLFCTFHGSPGSQYFILGVAQNVELMPRRFSGAYIAVYKLVDGDDPFELVHKTEIEDIPLAFCAFRGRLLVGLGRTLRMYDLGKKKLLRKCEHKGFPHMVVNIQTQTNRIVVADVQESVHFVLYKPTENQFHIFADDVVNRWISSFTLLDYDSVAGGDKFGHFFVTRLSSIISEEIDADSHGVRLNEKSHLLGAPHKLESAAEYFVGDTLTSISKATLVYGGREVLVYTTISGGIGAMVPFVSREDVNFFMRLEMHMRNEAPPLSGRNHLAYRSYYAPVKNVIDGHLIEQFHRLPFVTREKIAADLERSPAEVSKKIEDMRVSVAF